MRVGRLHVITAGVDAEPWDALSLARRAVAGGADTVQLREKRTISARRLVEAARRMSDWLHERGAVLIVNDRVELAAAVQADGVHLGAGDMPTALARETLGTTALIGRTANDLAAARRAAAGSVDYLGVGPVFGTRSKAHPAATLGIDGLRRIVQAVDKPVIAIGGIDVERIAEVLDTGAHGVAVLSAVAAAADPARIVACMREAIERFGASPVGSGDRARVG